MAENDSKDPKDGATTERNRDTIRKALIALKDALAQETAETKEMLEIYLRFSQGKANKADLKKAEEQLQDLMRAAGLTIFSILPLAPLTIPALVKLGEKFGIEVLPSSFRKKKDEPKP